MDIEKLLQMNEGKTLEFKENALPINNILKTLVAFSNSAGGKLVIGITDKEKLIKGVKNPLDVEENLMNSIHENINPLISPNFEIQTVRNKNIVILETYPGPNKPYRLNKKGKDEGVYVRLGSSNRKADDALVEELRRSSSSKYYDESPLIKFNSEAIDFRVASELFLSKKELKFEDLNTLEIITPYENKKVPTIGGMILFGKEREKVFPDFWLQMGQFSGIDKSEIIDTREIHDNPFAMIEEGLAFVKKHASKSYLISGDGKRKEKWSVPLIAIREALINAFAHMDYSQLGAPVRLSIFSDRISIESPGILPFGLTIEDIQQGISKFRNKVIIRVMHELGYIEKWGSGIQRIMKDCKDHGVDPPVFQEIATRFRVTIPIVQKNEIILDEKNQEIIKVLSQYKSLQPHEIAKYIHLSDRATRNRLNSLKELGIIKQISTSIKDPKKVYILS